MFRTLILLLLATSLAIASPKAAPNWSEYEVCFHAYEGMQPVITIRWWSMDSDGQFQEYADIWRKGLTFGHGKRFQVMKLTGVNHDGIRLEGHVVTATIQDTKTKTILSFSSDKAVQYESYSKEWLDQWLMKYPPKKEEEKQDNGTKRITPPEVKELESKSPQPKSENPTR